jgi:hypothetical protein
LPNGDWVVADEQRFWLHPPTLFGAPCMDDALSETGSAERTRQLFAGILASAFRMRGRSLDASEPPAMSLHRHIFSLAASYHTTHATPLTLRQVAKRFREQGSDKLASYCEQGARDESGHDELALQDLRALGIDARVFVERLRAAKSLALIDFFQHLAKGPEPVAVLGYAYALERVALFRTKERVEAVEAVIPAGIEATRCLKVHSAIGAEVRHVDDSLAFIATLPGKERRAIAHAAYHTLLLMNAEPDYPGEREMRELIGQSLAATH